jgi:hypothetical protein
MILDSHNSEALRRLSLNGSNIEGRLDCITAFTLSGITNTVASAVISGPQNALYREIERYCGQNQNSALQMALAQWDVTDSSNLGSDIHGVRQLEFYRLRFRADQTSLAYQLYQERFARALQTTGGFPARFAKALAGALVEMTDNIVQHSETDPSAELTGLVGYHVNPRFMCFAAIDIGQGVLSSLRRAPAWRHLQTARQALRAAVCDFATSRSGEPQGDGFRTLFRTLVDRNCRLRFRSDDAVLTIEDLHSHREGTLGSSPALGGLQLSVCCSLNDEAIEEPIKTRT